MMFRADRIRYSEMEQIPRAAQLRVSMRGIVYQFLIFGRRNSHRAKFR